MNVMNKKNIMVPISQNRMFESKMPFENGCLILRFISQGYFRIYNKRNFCLNLILLITNIHLFLVFSKYKNVVSYNTDVTKS